MLQINSNNFFKELILANYPLTTNDKLNAARVGEELVDCLQPFAKEWSIKKLKTKYGFIGDDRYDKLRFDYYLPHLQLAIEFDGKQHQEVVAFFGGQHAFNQRVIYDQAKNHFCQQNGIKLIRLPHDSRVNDLYQELLKAINLEPKVSKGQMELEDVPLSELDEEMSLYLIDKDDSFFISQPVGYTVADYKLFCDEMGYEPLPDKVFESYIADFYQLKPALRLNEWGDTFATKTVWVWTSL